MIVISLPLRKFGWLSSNHIWLAGKPSIFNAARFSIYYSCDYNENVAGFRRFEKKALSIDLSKGAEHVLDECSTSLAYKVRRAQKEGVETFIETDMVKFRDFYNAFAVTAELPPLHDRYLAAYWPHMVVTCARGTNGTIAMHAYMRNSRSGRVSLLYSASMFRNETDSSVRNYLGRANRFLYWDDMRRFAAEGMKLYDFGYFGDDSGMAGVTNFKSEFPCFVRAVSTFVSLPLLALRTLRDSKTTF